MFLKFFQRGELFLNAHPAIEHLVVDVVKSLLVPLVFQLILHPEHLAVCLLTFLCTGHIAGLHTFPQRKLILQTEPLVILLLLDPVRRELVGSLDQLGLAAVDLPVDFLALLTPFLILFLELLPAGQLFFDGNLVVVFSLIQPVLKGIQAFLGCGNAAVHHGRRSVLHRTDAVVDADHETTASMFAQINKLLGG